MVNKKNESHDWHRRAEIKIITHIQIYFDLFPELEKMATRPSKQRLNADSVGHFSVSQLFCNVPLIIIIIIISRCMFC
jgi:hypothetical protein